MCVRACVRIRSTPKNDILVLVGDWNADIIKPPPWPSGYRVGHIDHVDNTVRGRL